MYIFIFIGTHFLVIMGIYLFCKYKAALMEQMMITMALSMSFGLVIGVLMGIIYHDNLLLSILMSMGISGLAGANLGLRLHGLAGIEGFFTAIMAGMMGSMLVGMLSMRETIIIFLVSSFLLTGTSMFSVRHILYRSCEHVIRKYDLLLLIATCCVFIITLWMFPDVLEQNPPSVKPLHL